MKPIVRTRCAVFASVGAVLAIAGICPETMAFPPPPAGALISSPRSPSTHAAPISSGSNNAKHPSVRYPSPMSPLPVPSGGRAPTASSALGLFSGFFDFSGSEETSRKILATATFGIILFYAYLIFGSVFYVVDAGEIGISSTLGNIERQDPGLHFRNPLLTSVEKLSTKTQLLEQSNFVPTKEGLTVELDTAILVKLDPDEALELYRSVGPDFVTKVVTPEASSSVRGLTSESKAKALYTAGRSEIQNRLKKELQEKLAPRGLSVEDVLLKNVVLPEALSKSIQEKARAEQESARMEFVLLKESQEAKRKAIEAQGIAEFQRIVSDGITPSMLQWKGIEATQKLASSPNSKVVIVGNNKDSLPIILGNDK